MASLQEFDTRSCVMWKMEDPPSNSPDWRRYEHQLHQHHHHGPGAPNTREQNRPRAAPPG